jgi:hypothetical protein
LIEMDKLEVLCKSITEVESVLRSCPAKFCSSAIVP